uniref:Leucine-rich repeats and calponin homology (CH) domain containing 4 n=1 Tax=Scleropages formosus TaxID=113540 RepID=A0A8C9ST00_SCLFO
SFQFHDSSLAKPAVIRSPVSSPANPPPLLIGSYIRQSPLPATIAASRSVEKALEEAASSGALSLSNRKLKEFPCSAKNYDLSDITHADLSKNRLCELPEELCQFISLETLSLYHNCIRSIPPTICHLQALTYLNISRNQLSCLPIAVCQLPLLRVLIVSNNKLSALPSAINKLAHLRQLDVSCNELQGLPVEVGQLEALRDLNLRRNQLTTLPEELSELPLVRLDVSCNRVSRVPVCYRHLRHLQTITLDNNPLLSPPAQICSKGKFHIFKFLNIEACKTTQEALERALRPTGFNSCLSDQELFSGRQYGGLDSGFNSVDSGSKRWSGNESADDFSELSLKMAEISKDQRNLQEEGEKDSMSERGKQLHVQGSQVTLSTLWNVQCNLSPCALPSPLTVWPFSKTLESRLKITLPEDLGEALSNGTILCQLANHIRPRAVSIIHIPSPAVPKLSAAKCRLNVENFLAACRKLGVPEVTSHSHLPIFIAVAWAVPPPLVSFILLQTRRRYCCVSSSFTPHCALFIQVLDVS